MKTTIFEATNGFNWGKFLVGEFDSEWGARSAIAEEQEAEQDFVGMPVPLLARLGWGHEHLWVLDLQTGEGALFRPGGSARADLEKHEIWVCPLFEPFLAWFYDAHREAGRKVDVLPRVVELPDAPSALYGYRRHGATE